jgi:hypothetical protein
VVEGVALELLCRRFAFTEGSNPSLSVSLNSNIGHNVSNKITIDSL